MQRFLLLGDAGYYFHDIVYHSKEPYSSFFGGEQQVEASLALLYFSADDSLLDLKGLCARLPLFVTPFPSGRGDGSFPAEPSIAFARCHHIVQY